MDRVTRFRPLAWTRTFPWREWLFIGVPVAIALIIALWIAARFIQPSPPRRVVLATGPTGSAYESFGERYREVFAREGVELELLSTKGARENYKLLRGPVAADKADGDGAAATPPAPGVSALA